MACRYERFTVPVVGGDLTCGRWGEGERVVVAAHGITGNHLSWQRAAELVDELSRGAVSVVAVDHRGRAGSAELPGPWGMEAHAADLVAVLDHLSLESAVLTGHSMGAFVVATTAESAPDRVDRLVLVDGGLPLPLDLPPDADVEAVVHSVIGPALERLDQRWPDEDTYLDLFRTHPAFQPPNQWTATVEAYVRYDAVPTPEGEIRSSVAKEAVLVDGGAAIVEPDRARSVERITTPSILLWAPRGILDQTPGLYPPELITETVDRLDHLEAELVPDTNHYTVLVGESGAQAVATTVVGAA